jgi:DNA processing protein
MDAELRFWLAVNRLPVLSAELRGALVEGRVAPARVLAGAADGSLPGRSGAAPGSSDLRGVEGDLEWLSGSHRYLLTPGSRHYPERLRHIADPPLVMFVEGDPGALATHQIAIVGSRRATPGGLEIAHDYAAALSRCGLVITSGLALGIDAAGHRGAMAAGGRTVAVAGNGLDRVYPTRHRQLADRVRESGALVSEFPPGTPPLAHHFPRRNRLISGLALGVLVVEATRRSGSLITARLAGEQGREVFAVPGSIHNPLARGCHQLIRQGAKLVESIEDIVEEIPHAISLPGSPSAAPGELGGASRKGPEGLEKHQRVVLESLAYEPTSIDLVVARSGLTAETVSSILLALELQGLVTPVPGGAYARVISRP